MRTFATPTSGRAPNVDIELVRGIAQPDEKVAQRLITGRASRFGRDFTAIPTYAAKSSRPSYSILLGNETTVNPDAAGPSDEELTQSAGPAPGPIPAPAPGVTPASPSPPAPTGQCHVESGPTYTPSGTIPVTPVGGGAKRATFSMAATFGTAYVTLPPRIPRCCEVRQYIKWNQAYHTWRGGPPHSGFPSSSRPDTWYEDRDSADRLRYGHRSGPHAVPVAGCGNEYLTSGRQDMADGDTYCGRDSPQSSAPTGGRYNFQLKVVDTCGGHAVRATSSVITINW